MIIVGLHSIHGIDSNTPEGAGAHPKEGGLRPTRHGGGGVGQLNSMSLTPARSTPVQLLLNDSQVSLMGLHQMELREATKRTS